MVDDIVAKLGCDLPLEVLDLFRPELGDEAAVEVDDVVVVGGVGHLVAGPAVFEGEPQDDAFPFKDREGAVDGGQRQAVVKCAGPAVQLGRVGVILGLGQDLEEGLPLAGHADSGISEGLGGVRFHGWIVAGGWGPVKRLGCAARGAVGAAKDSNGLGVGVRGLLRVCYFDLRFGEPDRCDCVQNRAFQLVQEVISFRP